MEDSYTQVLLDCVRRSSEAVTANCLESLSHEDWERLLTMAEQQSLLSLLYHRLKSRGFETIIPAQHLPRLREVYFENGARNLKIQSELGGIISALSSRNIPCIVLKGLHLAVTFYENQALREISDIDLLVPVSFVGQAAEVLSSLGYETQTSYKYDLEWQKTRYHLLFLRPLSIPVELHWNITLPHWCPSDIALHGLWERSIKVRIGDVDTLGLCSNDILMYLCFHACKHHRFQHGLRPLIDIAYIVSRADSIAWVELVDRSRKWTVDRSVHLVLLLAKELIGADVPSQVLADLRPADFNELIFSEARELIFADLRKHSRITPRLARWHNLGLYARLVAFFRRTFLPRINMAEKYNISPRSLKLYWYYLVRCKDLLARYGGTVFNLCQRDQELTSIARCKTNLDNYLDGTN